MLNLTLKDGVPANTAMSVLNRHIQKFGIIIDLDRCHDYISHFIELYLSKVEEFDSWNHKVGVKPSNTAEMLLIAKTIYGIPELKLLNPTTKKFTFDKKVRERLMNDINLSEEQRGYAKICNEMANYITKINNFKQWESLPKLKNVKTYDGNTALLARPTPNLLATMRIGLSNPSFQNIDRDLMDIVSYLKGQLLIYADSGQIEPRIKWSYFTKDDFICDLIRLYNDAYYGLLHYITSDPNDTKLEKKDLNKDNRDKLKTLLLATGYGSSGALFDTYLVSCTERRLKNHPAVIEWEERVRKYVVNGGETFYAPFGTAITPEETDTYKRNTQGWGNHLFRCGINNPVQGAAAELMNISICEADKILSRDVKYKDLASIAAYQHDAGYFYISEDENPSIIERLQGCLAYQVEDWIPIYSEGRIGRKPSKIIC